MAAAALVAPRWVRRRGRRDRRDRRHHDHPLHAALHGSATVERGARVENLAGEQREAVAGAIADLVAAFIIIATGATLFTHGIHSVGSASDAAKALEPFAGQYAEALFGIGLLGASLLACAILPIATSYVVSESLGFEKGLGHSRRDAPVFVGLITAMIAIATIVAVIPGIPVINLLIGVQVVNGVLLPINLCFIWRPVRRNRRSSWASTATTASSTSSPPPPCSSPPRSRSPSSPSRSPADDDAPPHVDDMPRAARATNTPPTTTHPSDGRLCSVRACEQRPSRRLGRPFRSQRVRQ